MQSVILAILLSFTPYHLDTETPDERRARLTQVSSAIVAAVQQHPEWRRLDAAAALVVLGKFETHFAQYIGAGQCRTPPGKLRKVCDPDKHGNPQSLTYWQLKKRACKAAHSLADGSRAQLRAAAACASRLWVSALNRCKAHPSRHRGNPIASAFSGYGKGVFCGARSSLKRAMLWKSVRARIQAGGSSPPPPPTE